MKKFIRPLPTPESLAVAALRYLERYASSEANLRSVLSRRIRIAAMQHKDFAENAAQQLSLRDEIEAIVALHKKNGAINDASYSSSKINSLRREGKSRRVITQKLLSKGVAKDIIRESLTEHDSETTSEESEYQAALRLAKKRKLGSYRLTPDLRHDEATRTLKDRAILARAGFSSTIIRRVLGSRSRE